MKKNHSELTVFLLQLSFFLLPIGLIVPLFLSPGFVEIVFELEVMTYLQNLLTGTYGFWLAFEIVGAGALFLGLLWLILQKQVVKYCTTKTTLAAFGLGGFGSATLFCLATFVIGFITSGTMHRHPLQISWGLGLGLLFLVALIALAAWYVYHCFKSFHLPTLLLDVATAIITFIALLPLGSTACNILSDLAKFLQW